MKMQKPTGLIIKLLLVILCVSFCKPKRPFIEKRGIKVGSLDTINVSIKRKPTKFLPDSLHTKYASFINDPNLGEKRSDWVAFDKGKYELSPRLYARLIRFDNRVNKYKSVFIFLEMEEVTDFKKIAYGFWEEGVLLDASSKIIISKDSAKIIMNEQQNYVDQYYLDTTKTFLIQNGKIIKY